MKPVLRRLLAALCFLTGLLPQFVDAKGARAATEFEPLVEELDRIRQASEVAAFGLVIVDGNGILHLEARGLSDRASAAPIQNDAVFRIGSISKMFTALAALQLAASSGFDLDTPIAEWDTAAYYDNSWSASHPITTAMLLEHTAGLTDMAKAEWDYSDPRPLPLDKTLRLYPQARQAQWRPGLHASYSNAGAGLAGRVMELASGQSYEELMDTLVFLPLGLQDTTVFPPDARLPVGYDRDGKTPIPYWHQIFRPFAAINSTLHDLGRFIVMLINHGRIDKESVFSETLIQRLEAPRTSLAARSGLRFGYGLGNYTWLRNGVLFHGHGGDADGYLSKLGYARVADRGYFLVITAFQGKTLRRMQRRVESFLTAGLATVDAPPKSVLSPAQQATRVGVYTEATQRFPGGTPGSLEILLQGDTLFTRLNRRKRQQLIPVSEMHYRRETENRATTFLGPDARGRMVYQDDTHNFVRSNKALD